jgi:hypothetical protein
MPRCTDAKIDFGRFGRRVIEADFSGGDLSSDGGMLLLRQVDEHLGLSRAAAAAIPDPRDPERITHPLRDLLAQRLYGLCCGYEDLNDPKALRGDVRMQTAVGRDEALGSAPTFSRLENRATRAQAWALHEVQAAQFIASHDKPPAELVLDIDASDVPLHGRRNWAPSTPTTTTTATCRCTRSAARAMPAAGPARQPLHAFCGCGASLIRAQ